MTAEEKKKIVADMIAADSSLAKMKMAMAAKPFKPREFKTYSQASYSTLECRKSR